MAKEFKPKEPGFYWLKIDGDWQPARWDGEGWWTLRMQGLIHECQELGPRIKTPDEIRQHLKDTTSESYQFIAGYGDALKWVLGEEDRP